MGRACVEVDEVERGFAERVIWNGQGRSQQVQERCEGRHGHAWKWLAGRTRWTHACCLLLYPADWARVGSCTKCCKEDVTRSWKDRNYDAWGNGRRDEPRAADPALL